MHAEFNAPDIAETDAKMLEGRDLLGKHMRIWKDEVEIT